MSSRRLLMVDRRDLLRKELDAARGAGATVGLVATMGSLHRGHGSLIERSVAECDLTVVSIFVNPMQFDSKADLAAYPRDLAGDVVSADAGGANIVFVPALEEMYPRGASTTSVHVDALSVTLEGASRPGHFDGVATVVAKLFNVVGPCRAYFGEKDYQQLLVVNRVAEDLSFPVDVVACPTVRERDGLACSSRNTRLSPEQRQSAPVLYNALRDAVAEIRAGECDAGVIRSRLEAAISAEPLAALDYAELASSTTLEPVDRIDDDTRLLVAATFGTTRLIDNTGLHDTMEVTN